MKRILVINALPSNQYLSNTLKQNNIYSVGLYTLDFSRMTDYYKPHSELFDKQIYLPRAKFSDILDALNGMQFDYVLNGCDGFESTHLADSLAQYFTPQYANNPNDSEIRSDKIKMHEQLASKNLPHIQQLVLSKATYLEFIDKINYPAFIKPRNGDGSTGAMSINSNEELIEYFEEKNFTLNIGANISEYILANKLEGDEYLIDTFSIKGQHHVATIQKYEKRVVDGHPKVISCSVELDQSRCERISEYVKEVLNATNFNNGVAHLECFYTNDNKVILIEINPRISGAKALSHKLNNFVGKNNQIDILLQEVFAVFNNNDIHDKYATMLFLYNGGKNLMPDLHNLNLQKYGIVAIEQLIPAGEFSNEDICKVNDAAAIVILVANSIEELNNNRALVEQSDGLAWKVLS